MLFNSFEFIGLFLPTVLVVYFLLNRLDNAFYAKLWLYLSSMFFYAYWNPIYVPLILGSTVFNFYIGRQLNDLKSSFKKTSLLAFGVTANLTLLGFYKYFDFLIENVNLILGGKIPDLNITLPLAISFFTFQQIAYLSDSHKGLTKNYNFFYYGLFVMFFPQLIAGPIVHHKEMMPQFDNRISKKVNFYNIGAGLYMFFMGLCKKVIIADTFAIPANLGYEITDQLNFAESWFTSLSYAFQLYFDFSGYSDMAIGAALLFNIKLPWNFNSPYKALDIQDFWRRWHMTLSRFLRDYVYIPLGGNRFGEGKTIINLMITFLLGGIWHGAGWTFIMWGLLHGLAVVIHFLWKKVKINIPNSLALFLTFSFVNITWVFFRARSFGDAFSLLQGMFGFRGVVFSFDFYSDALVLPIMVVGVILLFLKNTNEKLALFKIDKKHLGYTLILMISGLLYLNTISSNEFLYFDF